MKELVLITGSSDGIGKEIASTLAKEGLGVLLVARRSDKLTKVKNEIIKIGGWCEFFECDLTVEKQIVSLFLKLKKAKLIPTYIVNNAGIGGPFVSLDNLSKKDWDKVISLNLTAVFIILKHFIPMLKKKKKGHIINISSIYGIAGSEGSVAYSTTKHGVIGLTKSVSLELLKYNIRCNAILPGFIQTKMSKTEKHKNLVKQKSSVFWGKTKDVAHLVSFLISDKSRFINGSTIVVDGGISAGFKINEI